MGKDKDTGKDLERQLEGEGSRTAARRYDEKASEFARSGKVDEAAEAAESAFDGAEGSGDREAEAEGKKHAAEEDPLLREDRSLSTKLRHSPCEFTVAPPRSRSPLPIRRDQLAGRVRSAC
jgi:hypothetical protein